MVNASILLMMLITFVVAIKLFSVNVLVSALYEALPSKGVPVKSVVSVTSTSPIVNFVAGSVVSNTTVPTELSLLSRSTNSYPLKSRLETGSPATVSADTKRPGPQVQETNCVTGPPPSAQPVIVNEAVSASAFLVKVILPATEWSSWYSP